MLTLNWLFESAEDRFYERGGEALVLAPRTHACPLCSQKITSSL